MRALMIVLITITLWSSPLAALSQSAGGTEAEHQEWLSFSFDVVSPQSAQAVLRIGKSKVPIKIEAAERANRS